MLAIFQRESPIQKLAHILNLSCYLEEHHSKDFEAIDVFQPLSEAGYLSGRTGVYAQSGEPP